jgi:predicted nuclease of predicted toxin-antitoxin system
MPKFILFCVLVLAFAVCSEPATATTLKELQLGIRTLNYMLDPPRGRAEVAILYDTRSAESGTDARNLQAWLGSAATLPNIELVPVLVDVSKLDTAQTFRIGVATDGLASQFNRIFDYARRSGMLIISADLDCVRSAKCAVGISASPSLEVFINHEVTNACRINFLAGFRMMVKEL